MPWVDDRPPNLPPPAALLRRHPAWRRYGLALLLAALALAMSVALRPFLESTRFLLLFPAVVTASWYGGFLPGLLTTVLVALGAELLLVPPAGSLALTDGEEVARLALFLLVVGQITALTESLRTSRERAQAAADEARSASERLHAQKRRTELILRSVSDGITVQSPQGRLLYANEAAARLVGFDSGEDFAAASPADVSSRFEIFDEHGRPLDPERLPGRRALAGEGRAEALVRYRDRVTGREAWSMVRATAVADDATGGPLAVNTFHDLTELMEAQRTLEENARRLEDLTTQRERALTRLSALQRVTEALSEAHTPDEVAAAVVDRGVVALDARTAVLVLLDEGGEHLELIRSRGLPSEVEAAWRRFPLDRQVPVAEAVRTGSPVFVSVREEDAGPRHALARGTLAAVPVKIGEVTVGALGVGLDEDRGLVEQDRELLEALARQCGQALERARLFEAERTARAEAEAASSAKSRFLAVMSHELRTPLNAILGYEQLLEEGIVGPVNETQREQLGRIRASTRHLLSLIEQILSLSRIEADREEVRAEPVDVGEVVRDAASLVMPMARQKGLSLEVDDLTGGGVTVRTDPDKLRQILLNLLSNAVKFTPTGRVRLVLSADAHGLSVEVRDTGPGIPEEERERIFEPFFQGRGRDAAHGDGTGLGLAVSRELATLLGGSLEARSPEDGGAVFTLRLPGNDG